jgi:heptosyltransferase-1
MAKILIVRLGSMGDILHALPAVTGIRAALPNAIIGWLVEERWSELLTAQGRKASPSTISPKKPLVNHVHTIDTRRWRKHFFRLLAKFGAPGSIAGFVNPREPAARFFYGQRFSREGEHVIEQNHALAAQALQQFLGESPLQLLPPKLPHDPTAEEWAEAEIARLGIASFALVTPGAGWGAKQWPAERFGEVARALAVHNIKTLVNAAPGEEALARAVVAASAGNAFDVRCTIGQLIALTRRARIFIGGDTGPLHLAASLGIPAVALYGPTDPARTGPFGTRAIALRHPESETTFSHHRETEEGLLKITAEEVISAARHLLGGNDA